MRSLSDIHALLERLDDCVADDLEGQDLDFKQWIDRSLKDAVSQMIEMAGEGTVLYPESREPNDN